MSGMSRTHYDILYVGISVLATTRDCTFLSRAHPFMVIPIKLKRTGNESLIHGFLRIFSLCFHIGFV